MVALMLRRVRARRVSSLLFGVLFGRYLTVSSELARTGGIRLSN